MPRSVRFSTARGAAFVASSCTWGASPSAATEDCGHARKQDRKATTQESLAVERAGKRRVIVIVIVIVIAIAGLPRELRCPSLLRRHRKLPPNPKPRSALGLFLF